MHIITTLIFASTICMTVFVGSTLLQKSTRELVLGSLSTHSKLTYPPTRLSTFSVVTLFLLVVSKYIIRPIGELSGLIPSLQLESSTSTFRLPRIEVSAPLTYFQQTSDATTAAVTNSTSLSSTPGQRQDENSIFLLTALTNPLLLLTLTKFQSPILPFGAVNVRNRFEFVDIHACRHLRSARTGALRAIATMGGSKAPGRRVKRGMEFDVTVKVFAGAASTVIFRQVFTILQMFWSKAEDVPVGKDETQPMEPQFEANTNSMKIDANAPTRWAAVCKDYNPIHMHALAARLFWIPGQDCTWEFSGGYGNGVGDRVDQELQCGDARAGKALVWNGRGSWLEVAFKRPMVVPLLANVKWLIQGREDGKGMGFHVVSTNKKGEVKLHVEARAGVLA